MEVFNKIFSWLGDKLNILLNALCAFLPNSPFTFLAANSEFSTWLGWLNWFIPINTFVAIGQAWLTCIGVYYLIQVGLRWVKAIE